MTDEGLARMEAVFHAAAALVGAGRAAYLDRECTGDAALRTHVEAMLERLERDESLGSPLLGPGTPVSEGPGTTIDRYKLLQVIGEGGFGIVYMAEQVTPVLRKVAIKIIKLGMDTKEVVARFEAERQALAMMDHPNIARVLDGGATETGRPYFVMELVRGVSITEYCDEHKLPTRERLTLFESVCHAVQHAHQKGVIHRDIKPTNVMVSMNDGAPIVKVIDFGIAKAMHTRLTEKTLFTEYHRFIGTPAYMSPEQAEMSALDVDTRTDIYSLGVLLYELLTGSTPFDTRALLSAGMAEIQRVIREEPPQRPSLRISSSQDASIGTHRSTELPELSKRLRGELDWIVMKALEKERGRRYGTASDFAADIRRHLTDEPVEAGPPTATYRLRKFLVRNRAAAVSTALVGLVLVGGIVGTTLGMLAAARSRDDALRSKAEARVVTDFLVATISLADPRVALRPEVTMRDVLARASAEIPGAFEGHPEAEARVRGTVGRAYGTMGDEALAEAHLRRAAELIEDLPGYDPPDRYSILWALTHACFTLDRPDAYEIAGRARRVAHDWIRGFHPELAGLLDAFIDAVYEGAFDVSQGAMDGALALLAEVAGEIDRTLAPGDELLPMVADTFMAAGYTCWYGPNEFAAEHFFGKAHQIQQRELPAGHPQVSETMGILVGVLSRAGKPDAAESRMRESVRALRKVYQDGDFELAFAESMLAEVLVSKGEYEEAERLLLASDAVIRRTVQDDTHFYAMLSLTRMVQLYDAWGKEAEAAPRRFELAQRNAAAAFLSPWPQPLLAFGPAEAALLAPLDRMQAVCGGFEYSAVRGDVPAADVGPALDDLLAVWPGALGLEHPLACVVARLSIGWSHAVAEEGGDAVRERIATAAIPVLRRFGPPASFDLADALAQLACIAHAAGDAPRATSLADEAYELIRDGKSGSWFHTKAKLQVAECLIRVSRFHAAESLLSAIHDTLDAQLGDFHPFTQHARSLLARLYQAWGRPEPAAPVQSDATEDR